MSANAALQNIRFGEFEVDFAKRELRGRGSRIHLQPKPFQILEMLLECPGALVRRDEMARCLWPALHVNFERSLNTAVNTLRQALGDSSHRARFIETRSGLGYAFIAKVEHAVDHDYLKGRSLLEKMTEVDTRKAIAYFESARGTSPVNATEYANLALMCLRALEMNPECAAAQGCYASQECATYCSK